MATVVFFRLMVSFAAAPYDVFHACELCYTIEDACQIAELCGSTSGGEMFTIDRQLGEEGGYDGLEKLRRYAEN